MMYLHAATNPYPEEPVMPRTSTGQFRKATAWEQAKAERAARREAQAAVVKAVKINNAHAMARVAAAHGRTA